MFGKFEAEEGKKMIEYGLHIVSYRMEYEHLNRVDIESTVLSYEGAPKIINGILFRCKSKLGYAIQKDSQNILYIPDRESIHITHQLNITTSQSYYLQLSSSFSLSLQSLPITAVIYQSEAPLYQKDVLSLLEIPLYEVIFIQHARCTNFSSNIHHFQTLDIGLYIPSCKLNTILQRFETLLIIEITDYPILLLNDSPFFSRYKETLSDIVAIWKHWALSEFRVINSGCLFQVILGSYFDKYSTFSGAVWNYVRIFYLNISKLLPQSLKNFLQFKLMCQKEPHFVEITEEEDSYVARINRNSETCIEGMSCRINQVRHILEICIILLRLY